MTNKRKQANETYSQTLAGVSLLLFFACKVYYTEMVSFSSRSHF